MSGNDNPQESAYPMYHGPSDYYGEQRNSSYFEQFYSHHQHHHDPTNSQYFNGEYPSSEYNYDYHQSSYGPGEYSEPSYESSSSPPSFSCPGEGNSGGKRKVMVVGSNKKERRRTQSINNAFASLRDCIPNVPCDTKLSKIKTLRLATSYIDYLITLLNSENSEKYLLEGFKVDIHKKWNEKTEEQKRRELEAELNSGASSSRSSSKACKGGARTGWPQHVWALELKQ